MLHYCIYHNIMMLQQHGVWGGHSNATGGVIGGVCGYALDEARAGRGIVGGCGSVVLLGKRGVSNVA